VPNAALRFTPDTAAASGGGITGALAPPRGRRGQGGNNTKTATMGRGAQQSVYVLGEDGKPQPVQITTGDTNGSMTEVLGGQLKPGMKVITGKLASESGSSGGSGKGSGRRQGSGQGGGQRSGGQ
jgi:HlyD family secretion protein